MCHGCPNDGKRMYPAVHNNKLGYTATAGLPCHFDLGDHDLAGGRSKIKPLLSGCSQNFEFHIVIINSYLISNECQKRLSFIAFTAQTIST